MKGVKALEKEVKPFGNKGAHIIVPAEWLGYIVKLNPVSKTPAQDETS